jgi:hypothetical protein
MDEQNLIGIDADLPEKDGIRVKSSVGRLATFLNGPNYFAGRVSCTSELIIRVLCRRLK